MTVISFIWYLYGKYTKSSEINLNLEAVVFTLDEFNQDSSDLVVEVKNKGEKIA